MALELLLHCPGYWEAAIAVSQPAVPQRPAVPFPGEDGSDRNFKDSWAIKSLETPSPGVKEGNKRRLFQLNALKKIIN